MQILGAANKPINEWTADSLNSGLKPLVETVELKGVPMERKNIIFKDDLDDSVNKLVDNLAKEGVIGG
jgi:electron transfer flavoprotein alpha/beta subunit